MFLETCLVLQNLAKWLAIWLHMDAIFVLCGVHTLVKNKVWQNVISFYHSILWLCSIGAKPQHYPLFPPRPPQKKDDINIKHPDFDPYNLPIWTLENYWKIQRLEDVKGKKTQQAAVVKETGCFWSSHLCSQLSLFTSILFSTWSLSSEMRELIKLREVDY